MNVLQIPSWPQADEREAEMLQQVLASSQWGGFHPYVTQFERTFASYQGCSTGISAFNGTVTLELALTVLGIGPGDEVIVPATSFISTATAVSRVGATPVFVDIEPLSFNMDPEQVRRAFSKTTKGVIAVHFGGAMCRIDELLALCNERGVPLLEDAAHAHGSEWNGQRAGSFGIAGSFSFQNGKVLCAGEGGMLVTSDAGFAEAARSLANQGRTEGRSFYEHARIGTNFRMTAFQAGILIAQFERLPEQIARRTANVCALKGHLADVGGIEWQEQPAEITQNPQYLLLGRVTAGRSTRDWLCQQLGAAGVPCTPFYPHALYQNPVYQQAGSCRVLPCPQTEARLRDAFWIGHRALLSDPETIAGIGELLRLYCGG